MIFTRFAKGTCSSHPAPTWKMLKYIIYTWNLFVLYFGVWTLQKKALSIQNKGHLGSRHLWNFTNWYPKQPLHLWEKKDTFLQTIMFGKKNVEGRIFDKNKRGELLIDTLSRLHPNVTVPNPFRERHTTWWFWCLTWNICCYGWSTHPPNVPLQK